MFLIGFCKLGLRCALRVERFYAEIAENTEFAEKKINVP
jgi:hypothetical protein